MFLWQGTIITDCKREYNQTSWMTLLHHVVIVGKQRKSCSCICRTSVCCCLTHTHTYAERESHLNILSSGVIAPYVCVCVCLAFLFSVRQLSNCYSGLLVTLHSLKTLTRAQTRSRAEAVMACISILVRTIVSLKPTVCWGFLIYLMFWGFFSTKASPLLILNRWLIPK